jgi:hypothetical protein
VGFSKIARGFNAIMRLRLSQHQYRFDRPIIALPYMSASEVAISGVSPKLFSFSV